VFIAEDGPMCFKDNQDKIQDCFQSTLGKYADGEFLATLPSLVANNESCADMDLFEKCMISHIEKCDDKTPANLVGSLFKFVRNQTPCRNYHKNSGLSVQLSAALFFILFMQIVLYLT
jgi:hypothetical protein